MIDSITIPQPEKTDQSVSDESDKRLQKNLVTNKFREDIEDRKSDRELKQKTFNHTLHIIYGWLIFNSSWFIVYFLYIIYKEGELDRWIVGAFLLSGSLHVFAVLRNMLSNISKR